MKRWCVKVGERLGWAVAMIGWGCAWGLVAGLRLIVRLLSRLGRGVRLGRAAQPFFPDDDLGPRPAVRPRHPAGRGPSPD